jgi:hypothetical protein
MDAGMPPLAKGMALFLLITENPYPNLNIFFKNRYKA